MSTISSKNNLYHFGIPRSYSFAKDFFLDDNISFTIAINVDKKDKIKELFFYGDQHNFWTPFYARLAKNCEGIDVDKVLSLTYQDIVDDCCDIDDTLAFLPIPLIHLRCVIDDFLAREVKEYTQKLLCRCFNVSFKQIQIYLSENVEAKLSDIISATRASAGCSSCLEDLTQYFQDFFANTSSFVTETSSCVDTDADIELIQKLIEQFLQDKNLKSFYQIVFSKQIKENLYFSITPKNKSEEIFKSFQEYLIAHLGDCFDLYLQ